MEAREAAPVGADRTTELERTVAALRAERDRLVPAVLHVDHQETLSAIFEELTHQQALESLARVELEMADPSFTRQLVDRLQACLDEEDLRAEEGLAALAGVRFSPLWTEAVLRELHACHHGPLKEVAFCPDASPLAHRLWAEIQARKEVSRE